MQSPKRLAFMLALLATGRFSACSPKAGDTSAEGDPFSNGGGGRGASSRDASVGGSSANPGTGPFHVGSQDGGGHVINGPDGSCRAISQAPEVITVYKDATVTDTVTTYDPVALYIMQDRSGSMDDPSGNQTKWEAAVNGVTTFVNQPSSAGLDVGLAVFEPKTGGPGMCDGSDCGQPVVPIGPLPQNAGNIVAGINSVSPNGKTPIECALRGAVNHCLVYQSQSPIGEKCVVVFITDGEPTSCNEDPNYLAAIAADAYSKNVLVFALGMQGANFNFLNQVAQAGGTGQAFDVTLQAEFEKALDTIRNKVVTVSSSHQVVTQTVIATELPCQWKVPDPPAGKAFEKDHLNVSVTRTAGGETQFGRVGSSADCARAGDGWYYDDPNFPTEIFVCPKTCDMLKKSTDVTVNILFGCATVPVKFN